MLCRICKKNEGTIIGSTSIYKGKKYIYYSCVRCNTEKYRKYRNTDNGKIAVKRAVKKYEGLHPERRAAWNACRELGTKPCEVCGVGKTDKHHPDTSKQLDVVWLCRLHHKQAHRL
jgi:protein-arginine kinase activator protein McsA